MHTTQRDEHVEIATSIGSRTRKLLRRLEDVYVAIALKVMHPNPMLAGPEQSGKTQPQ